MESHWQIVNSGRTIVSNSPEELWANACKYFEWCDQNPITVKRTLTSGREAGKKVPIEQPRPYSIKALCLHCGIVEEYLRDLKQSKDKSSLYYIVVTRIAYVIYVQNLEYAITGIFSPVFTSRVLNMDKDDIPTNSIKVEIVTGLPELSKSESEILEKLEWEKLSGPGF